MLWQHTYIYSVLPLISAVNHLLPQAYSTKWIIPLHIIVLHFFVLNIPVVIISWLSPTRLSQSQRSLSVWSLWLSSLSTGSCVSDFSSFCDHLPLHYHRHHYHHRHQQMIRISLIFHFVNLNDLNVLHSLTIFHILLLNIMFFFQVWVRERMLLSLTLRPTAPPTAVLSLSLFSCLSLPSSLQASVFISTNRGM